MTQGFFLHFPRQDKVFFDRKLGISAIAIIVSRDSSRLTTLGDLLQRLFFFFAITFSFSVHSQNLSSSEDLYTGKQSTVWIKTLSVKKTQSFPHLSITQRSVNQFLSQYLKQFTQQKVGTDTLHALTVDDIHGAADALTLFYRQAGLLFHRAIVPPQEITSGHIELNILTSKLAGISVIGNKHYDTYKIAESFQPLLNQPVEKDKISGALARTNELPGLQVFGYFSAGREQGDTHVNLKILEETRWISTWQADNYGIDSTGEYRISADLKWISPTGTGDLFHLGIVQTTQPTNNTYGFVQYRIPFFRDSSTLYLGYSNNQFELGETFSALLINGESNNINFGFDQRLWQSRKHLWELNLGYLKHESELVSEFDTALDSELTLQRASLGSRYRFKGKKLIFGLSAEYRSLTDDAEESYQTLSMSGVWYCRCFGIDTLRLVGKSQNSDNLLPSTDRLSLGGSLGVRAVDAGYLSVDSGNLTRLESHFRVGRTSSFFLFYDHGLGEKLDNTDPVEYQFAAAGIGIQTNLNKNWQMGVSAGKVIAADQTVDKATTELSIVDDISYLAEIRYQLKK